MANRTSRVYALTFFSIAAVAFTQAVSAATLNTLPQSLYWYDTFNDIWRADLDGSNVTSLNADSDGNIGDIATDLVHGHVYWTTGFSVSRSNLDGTNQTQLVTIPKVIEDPNFAPHNAFPGDIALDVSRGQMFFVDARHNIIYRSALDGTNLSITKPASGVPSNVGGISDIWIDTKNEQVYWSYDGVLERSSFDGSQTETLFDTGARVVDFEIDEDKQQIYWTSFPNGGVGSEKLLRANLDGSNRIELVSSPFEGYAGLALDLANEQLYYTYSRSTSPSRWTTGIRKINLDGSVQVTLAILSTNSARTAREISLAGIVVPEPTSSLLLAFGAVLAIHRRPSSPVRA